jgi:hypothetical protein
MSPSFRLSSASERDALPVQSRALAGVTVSGISPYWNSKFSPEPVTFV